MNILDYVGFNLSYIRMKIFPLPHHCHEENVFDSGIYIYVK